MKQINYSDLLDRAKKAKGLKTDSDLSSLLGLSANTIATWRARNTADLEKIISICDDEDQLSFILLNYTKSKTINKNKDEVITGRNIDVRTLVIATDQKGEELLQFVPAFAHAGYLTGFSDPEYIENLPTMSITGMLPSGTYRGWEVKGDSMEPTYRPGDKIIARYQEDWYRIKTGNTYVIVSTTDVVIKRVVNKLKDENRIICQSDNKYYPEYDIEGNEIIEIWSVEAFVRIGQTAPKTNIDDLRHEIDRLRNELGK